MARNYPRSESGQGKENNQRHNSSATRGLGSTGKAKLMGMASRTELIGEIARGYIETRKALSTQEKQILGKS
jgi:hypothetical protein